MIIVIAILLLIIVLSNPVTARMLGIVAATVFMAGGHLLIFAALAFVGSVIFALTQ